MRNTAPQDLKIESEPLSSCTLFFKNYFFRTKKCVIGNWSVKKQLGSISVTVTDL